MNDRELTAGGIATPVGVAALTLAAWLHPMSADPSDARAAFTGAVADLAQRGPKAAS